MRNDCSSHSSGFSGRSAAPAALLMFCGFLLSGCTLPGFLVGAAATGGIAHVQERTVEAALDDVSTQFSIETDFIDEDPALFLDVDTTVIEGRVLLTGLVTDRKDRVDAARIAWNAPGVVEVINEIEVSDQSTLIAFPKDAWISAKLRLKLMRDEAVKDINYDVETVNGAIYLIGIAQDEEELRRVTAHARGVGGVGRVVSYVRFKDAPDGDALATGSISAP
jgi:osmotically-inducible protein OsmY